MSQQEKERMEKNKNRFASVYQQSLHDQDESEKENKE